jgi:hypothetical protein
MKPAFALAAALVAVPLAAQTPPPLTIEQRTGLRCSAAFAIAAQAQARGDAEALSLPPLAQRGREFFVRFSAQLMDDTGMTRDAVAALLTAEAQALGSREELRQVMPACLLLLDTSGV